jgi:5-methylcytosine-specific restriction endonuclease McrA
MTKTLKSNKKPTDNEAEIKGVEHKKSKVKKTALKEEKDIVNIDKTIKPKRTVTAAQKKFIAGRQFNKCANKPGANLKGFETYECPLWKRDDDHKGCFDQSGYDIDHIVEFSLTQNDTDDNLQALCKSCHSMKTKKFAMKKKTKKEDN